MEPVLFILLITVAGSSGFGIFNQCELSRCDTFTPKDVRKLMRNFPPNDEEMREICPPMLEAIECFSSMFQQCIGELFEDFKAFDNVTVAQLTDTILNVMSLLREMCDEESQLGRDVRASASCLKKAISERNVECQTESDRLYDAFRFPEGSDAEEIMESLGDKIPKELRCLTASYEMACKLKEIQENCGSVARDVLLQVVKRPKMLRMGICTEEDLLTLRGQFLDFLEEQGEHRAFFANAFEFRKRRK